MQLLDKRLNGSREKIINNSGSFLNMKMTQTRAARTEKEKNLVQPVSCVIGNDTLTLRQKRFIY